MDFNPRAATGIPTEPVGSIPRSLKLQQAFAAYDAKKITKTQLEEEQNAAVADTIKRFEATGSPIITDGEQRVSSFATYPIADTLWPPAASISQFLPTATIASCLRLPVARSNTTSTPATS